MFKFEDDHKIIRFYKITRGSPRCEWPSGWQQQSSLMMEFTVCLENYCNSSTVLLFLSLIIFDRQIWYFPTWSFQDGQSEASIFKANATVPDVEITLISLSCCLSLHQSLRWKFTECEVIKSPTCTDSVTETVQFDLITDWCGATWGVKGYLWQMWENICI